MGHGPPQGGGLLCCQSGRILTDIKDEPIDGLDILAIEPHLIARKMLECQEEVGDIPLSRGMLARIFEDFASISDEEIDVICSG